MVTYQTRYIVAGAIGVPTLAGECLAETRRVHEDAVDAILTRGVWVGFGGLKPRQVVIIDLTRLRLCRISPVGKRPFANPTKDFVELCFADEESIVLWGDLAVGIDEIEVSGVVGLDYLERSPPLRSR